MKKTIAIVIMGMFLLTSFSTLSAVGMKAGVEICKIKLLSKTTLTPKIIVVPDDYPTIFLAIFYADYCDKIYVRAGTYQENLYIYVAGLEIIGERAATTIIDGGGSGDVVRINAFNVNISGFTIQNGDVGVTFGETFYDQFNTISNNIISNNGIGVKIPSGVIRSNRIYHNNFLNNSQNAYDPAENTFWYNPEIEEGNYWDDYTGEDNDGDGIGDTSYIIPGYGNQDLYPLIDPCVIQPDLECDDTLSWTDVSPGSTLTDTIYVENIGDAGTELDWEISEYPSWGTWTFAPSGGDNLKPEEGSVAVEVTVIAPNQQNQQFSGEVKIVNKENSADFYKIPVSLATPTNQISSNSQVLQYLQKLVYQLPMLGRLLNLQ